MIKGLDIQLTSRERNILILAGITAAIFLLSFVLPAVQGFYQQRENNIDSVLLDLSRESRFIEDSERWQARRAEVEARRAELNEQIYSGGTIPLIEAAIQRDLTQYARDADIDISSTRLAQRQQTRDWILVSQEMAFRTNDANNTITLLRALETSTPRLHVKDFSLDRSRQQFTGSITVVGFARSDGLVNNSSAN